MLTCACLCVCVYMHIHRCTYIHLSVYMWVYMYMLYTLTSVFLLNTSYWISPTKRVLLTFLLNFLECLNNFIFSSNDMKFSLHPILIFSAILKNISFERLQEKLSPLLFWIFEIQIKLAFFPELIKTYVLENGWKWMKRNSETKNYLHLVYWIYQNTILFFFKILLLFFQLEQVQITVNVSIVFIIVDFQLFLTFGKFNSLSVETPKKKCLLSCMMLISLKIWLFFPSLLS